VVVTCIALVVVAVFKRFKSVEMDDVGVGFVEVIGVLELSSAVGMDFGWPDA